MHELPRIETQMKSWRACYDLLDKIRREESRVLARRQDGPYKGDAYCRSLVKRITEIDIVLNNIDKETK